MAYLPAFECTLIKDYYYITLHCTTSESDRQTGRDTTSISRVKMQTRDKIAFLFLAAMPTWGDVVAQTNRIYLPNPQPTAALATANTPTYCHCNFSKAV